MISQQNKSQTLVTLLINCPTAPMCTLSLFRNISWEHLGTLTSMPWRHNVVCHF